MRSSPICLLLFLTCAGAGMAQDRILSHPPLRKNPPPSQRPLQKGPAYFVDGQRGDDKNAGTEKAPWRTIGHALKHIGAGATLCLRGGHYFENLYVSHVGRNDAPITIRSYPGEQAIIDGGLPEFQQAHGSAWEPYTKGGKDEFRSTKSYPNIRDVVAAFGDSDVGLQTYWHLSDLRSESGLTEQGKDDLMPLYCGPGVYYDRETGRIHARLAHTDLAHFDNYKGETDPRKLPLVIAPFRSIPLHVDQAKHVRFQDLVIRGGGYETCVVTYGVDVEFDNVTIRGGTYCMRTENTGPFRFHRSGLYGNAPPWSFRGDGSLRARPGRPTRDIARLTCHAVWVTDTGREFSVYAFPMNDDWEVSYSEFTDSHDGPYLGGISVRFHHNIIDKLQDDGLYLSQMYPRHLYNGNGARIEIYQNQFSRVLTPIAFGGTEDTRDDIYIYRNIFDLRGGVLYGRPSTKNPDAMPYFTGRILSDHGGPPWPKMSIYHNTAIARAGTRTADMGAFGAASTERPRRVFNNIFCNFENLAALNPMPADKGISDGNLYWSRLNGPKLADGFFKRYRSLKEYQASKSVYPPGSTTNSKVADPLFVKAAADGTTLNDYRLQKGSPAIDAGVPIPNDWPDSLRDVDGGRPDIGAIPLGADWQAGRRRRGRDARETGRAARW